MKARGNKVISKSISLLVILFISAGIYSCSSAGEFKDSTLTEKSKSLTFFNNEDGIDIHYKVDFSDGDIVSIQRDGKNIQKEDFDKYSHIVYDQIDDINGGVPHMKHFRAFTAPFDTQLFSEKMGHLSDKLSKLRDIDIHIDKDWGKDHDFFMWDDQDDFSIDDEDIDIHVNMDEISKEMKKAAEEIKKSMEEIKKIDFPGLKKEMLKVKKEIKEAGRNLKSSNSELRKLNSFIKKLKTEMVNDRLIGSQDEDVNLKIDDGEFFINDKKVDDKLAEKYKIMYKENFGHDINRRIRIKVR